MIKTTNIILNCSIKPIYKRLGLIKFDELEIKYSSVFAI